jgi:hypothetical protein
MKSTVGEVREELRRADRLAPALAVTQGTVGRLDRMGARHGENPYDR